MSDMIIKPTRLHEQKSDRSRLGTLVALTTLSLSTGLSYAGLDIALAQTSLEETTRHAVALTGTFTLTAGIYLSARAFGHALGARRHAGLLHNRSLGMPLLAATATAVLIGLSSATSFSSMAFTRYDKQLQTLMDAHAVEAITRPLDETITVVNTISANAAYVASLSSAKSAREETTGNACAPSTYSGTGAGPIHDMLADHAQRLNGVQSTAASLAKRAAGVQATLASGTTDAILRQGFIDAKALSGSVEFAAMRNEVSKLREGYAGQGFAWQGAPRACDDPAMVAALDRMLTALDDLPTLPAVAPVRSAPTLFDVIGMLADMLSSRTGGAVGIHWSSIAIFATIALALDFTGALSAAIAGRAAGRRLTPSERGQLRMTAWVLENFVWRLPSPYAERGQAAPFEEAYLVVPEGGDGMKATIAKNYAYCFNLHSAPHLQHCTIDDMPVGFERLTERLKLASGGATTFTLYPIIDQETHELIEAEKRLSALALWPNAVDEREFGNIDDRNWREGQTLGASRNRKIVSFSSYRSPAKQ